VVLIVIYSIQMSLDFCPAGLLSCSVPAVLCATATPVSAVAFLQSNLQELHQPDAEGEKAYVIQPGSSVATALSEGVPA